MSAPAAGAAGIRARENPDVPRSDHRAVAVTLTPAV